MRYRCANDLFNYCSEEPQWGKPPKEIYGAKFLGGSSCKLDPRTCGKHQTINQQLEGVVLPEGSSYRHVQAAKTKPRKKKKR